MKAYNNIYQIEKENRITRVFIILSIVMVVILFLPWTQNIRAKGKYHHTSTRTKKTRGKYHHCWKSSEVVGKRGGCY